MSGAVANGRQMSLRNEDIAVFALYQLGGVGRKVHSEEVADECYRLAPKRFGWKLPKFKDYGPDKQTVFYAIDGARDYNKTGLCLLKSFGTKATGGAKCQLTTQGVKWMEGNGQRIAAALNAKSAVAPKDQLRDIIRTVKNDQAFRRFVDDGGVDSLSVYDLVDFLGSSYETSPTLIRRKFAEMKEKAELTEEKEPQILEFLRACEREARFAHLLRPMTKRS